MASPGEIGTVALATAGTLLLYASAASHYWREESAPRDWRFYLLVAGGPMAAIGFLHIWTSVLGR